MANIANHFAFLLFWIIIIFALISTIPINLENKFYSLSLYYPFIALPIYLLYEKIAPIANVRSIDNVLIRVDLFFIWPALLFILLSASVRWVICIYKNRQQKDINEKKIQFKLILPLFAMVSAIWYLMVFG